MKTLDLATRLANGDGALPWFLHAAPCFLQKGVGKQGHVSSVEANQSSSQESVFIEMQTRLFVLMTGGDESGNQMHHKIDGTAMARVLNLRDSLELVENGLENGSLTQQQFVRKVYEMVFPVCAQPGHEVETLLKEQSRERSGNVSAISKELATQSFSHLRNRSAIIDVARSQTTGQQFPSSSDSQVQFQTKEPAHARLAPLGVHRKDTVSTDPFRIAHLQAGRVDETDPRAGSRAALQRSEQRNHHVRDQCDKASITHQARKFAGEMYLNMFGGIGFERPRVRLVKMDQNGHHLTWPELSRTRSLLASLYLAGPPLRRKAEHEIIDIAKQFEYTYDEIPPMAERSAWFCSYHSSSERTRLIQNSRRARFFLAIGTEDVTGPARRDVL